MIIYVIIYHIRNNKNYNIDMSIKYNTIISTVYQQNIYNYINFQRGRKKKKKRMYNNYSIYSYIENKQVQRIYHRLFGSKQKRKEKNILYRIRVVTIKK